MKYTVIVETWQAIDIDAADEQLAIQMVKEQLDPRVCAAANVYIAPELIYNKAKNTYKTEDTINDELGMDTDTSD